DEADWPVREPAQVLERRTRLIGTVLEEIRRETSLDELAETAEDPWIRALARRALRLSRDTDGEAQERILPGRLSATSLVALRADAHDGWTGLRRPMPQPPSAAADVGTAFHAWVEQHFGQSALLEVEPDASAVRDSPQLAQRLDALTRTFLDSPYALRSPEAVELSFELVLDAGHTPQRRSSTVHVPGKIDAVF